MYLVEVGAPALALLHDGIRRGVPFWFIIGGAVGAQPQKGVPLCLPFRERDRLSYLPYLFSSLPGVRSGRSDGMLRIRTRKRLSYKILGRYWSRRGPRNVERRSNDRCADGDVVVLPGHPGEELVLDFSVGITG